MAYQPIQMPGEPPMFRAMEGARESLRSLGTIRRQQAAEDEARQRQAQQDFQATFIQAKKLADAGDLPGARALLASYGAELGQSGGAPPPGPGMTPPAKPPQGGSPLPDGMEFRPGHSDADFDVEHGQAPAQQAPAPPPNPIMAAREAQVGQQQAANQQRARQVLNFRAPGGQQMTLDPEAARATQFEQKAARLDAAFAGIEDPEIKQIYQHIRPVLMSNAQDVDPTDVFKYIQGVATDRRAAEAATAKQAHDEAAATARETREADREDRRDARQVKSLEQSDKNSQRATAAAYAALANRGNPAEDKLRAETVLDLKGKVVGRALSPEEGEKLHDAHGATTSLLATLEKIKQFNAEHGTRLIPGVNATEIKDRDLLTAAATGHLTKMFETGVLQDKEYNRYAGMLKGSWLQDPDQANQNIDTLGAVVAGAYENKVKARSSAAPAANPIAAARAHQRDKNKARAGEAKRGGKGTPPLDNDAYLNMLGAGAPAR